MTPDKAVKKVWKLLLDPSIDKTLYIYIVINNKWYNQINIYASERFHSVKSVYICIYIYVYIYICIYIYVYLCANLIGFLKWIVRYWLIMEQSVIKF